MEEFIQFSAKTKNEAITKACIELGVSSDQLDIEVVSEGSSGFFGIGSKPAIIKARKINTVSEEDEIQEIVDTVKVDAIKEEHNKKPPKAFAKAFSLHLFSLLLPFWVNLLLCIGILIIIWHECQKVDLMIF